MAVRPTVPPSPSWEATPHWLRLDYTALGTAEGESASSASSLLFWRMLSRKLPEGQAVDVFPMEKLRLQAAHGWLCSQRAVPKDKSKEGIPGASPHPSAAHRWDDPVPEQPLRSGGRGGRHRATINNLCLPKL